MTLTVIDDMVGLLPRPKEVGQQPLFADETMTMSEVYSLIKEVLREDHTEQRWWSSQQDTG